jgi:hypothetical protein
MVAVGLKTEEKSNQKSETQNGVDETGKQVVERPTGKAGA